MAAALKIALPAQEEFHQAKRTLAYVYHRENIGAPSEHVHETAALKGAMLSLWIRHALPVYYEQIIHAGQLPGEIQVFAHETDSIFGANKRYEIESISAEGLADVKVINDAVRQIYLRPDGEEDHSLAVAIRFATKALAETWWQSRYLCLWVCLEALFGSDSEVSYRIALRIANFLGDTQESRKDIFDRVREAYRWRNRVAHGRPNKESEKDKSAEAMGTAEGVLQGSLQKILWKEPGLIAVFSGRNREAYLDEGIFR